MFGEEVAPDFSFRYGVAASIDQLTPAAAEKMRTPRESEYERFKNGKSVPPPSSLTYSRKSAEFEMAAAAASTATH